jgi:tetratricopeptide (TPR) repeat protein
LNVEAIVDGSVTHIGDRIRLNARLVRFPGEQTVFTRSYERDAADAFSLQNDLARNIAKEVGRSILPAEEPRLAKYARRVNPRLNALYLKGRALSYDFRREALEEAIRTLEHVGKEDPGNADVYASIANAWFNLSSVHLSPGQAMPKARAAAQKALAIDPQSDTAMTALGLVHVFYDWDWQSADAQLRKAVTVNPNSSDAYSVLGCLRLAQGRSSEALDAAEKSVLLDPRSFWPQLRQTFLFVFLNRLDDAIRNASSTLAFDPGWGPHRSFLGLAYMQKNNLAHAIRELEAAARYQPIPTTLGFLAMGYARAGRTAEAEKILKDLVAQAERHYVCPFEVAAAFAVLGRNDDAFSWMDRGVAERADCMVFLRSEPWLHGIHSDPRYAELMRRVGFPNS